MRMELSTASSITPVSPSTAAQSGRNPATESAINATFTAIEKIMFCATILRVFFAPFTA